MATAISDYFRKKKQMSYFETGLRKESKGFLPKRFPNTSEKISEYFPTGFLTLPDRFPSTSEKVFEYLRKGFRIPTERYPRNSFGIVRESDVFSHFRSKEPENILETLVEV